MLEEIIEIRRDLHKIPEEGNQEYKTRDYIVKKLKEYDIAYELFQETAVLAFIDANKDTAIAYRADMDGLSVSECNEVEYKSIHAGMMHACGHDGHMASVLAAAKVMRENKEKLAENILLIFQPAEEGPGGAKPIVDGKILEKYHVSKIYGTHVYPLLQEGVIGVRSGYIMAQTGEFYITVQGKSAHAAEPHQGIDSILAAAQLVTAVDEIKKELKRKDISAVISIGTFHGGERVNVIAETTVLSGTMRTYGNDVRAGIKEKINRAAKQIDERCRTVTTIRYMDMYPAVKNDEELYKNFIQKVPEAVNVEPSMLAEDFAYYQQRVPGVFFFTGTYNEKKGYIYPLHSNRFNFDEKILLQVMDIYLRLAGLDHLDK